MFWGTRCPVPSDGKHVYKQALTDTVFQLFRRNIFSVFGNDQIFLSAGKINKSIVIHIAEIARQAGMGKGSIYYYFPSKDAIVDALVERSYQKPLEKAYFHQKFQRHLIEQLKPVLTEIISQGIECGQICFDYPEEFAEIVLIVLSVKIDNTLIPSSREQIENTIRGLISLLEKGTGNPVGSLNFLTML